MTTLKKLVFDLILTVLSTMLSSCHAADDTMGLDVVGYNHTDHDVDGFPVDGGAGSYLGKHEGGGRFACCVSQPVKYTPGMTVTVTRTDEYNKSPQSRTVPVPPYTPEDSGKFAVHFLRDGQIKVFVTMLGPRHPNYPLKGDEARM
jgi:hypothetical protein